MHILTIDLEDWFHILDHPDTEKAEQWEKFESRVERNTERILQALEERKLTATFFVLGWVAEKYPNLIKLISEKHEIACHSFSHRLLYEQNRDSFREDLKKCIGLLQNITGKKVITYRSPGFSLLREHSWVLEELVRNKIEIDASVFPAARNHGGIPGFPYSSPCLIKGSNYLIKEFPMNTISLLGRQIVFSGGGYFRLLPYSVIRHYMKKSDYVMTYFHPRDFDPQQPLLKSLPMKRRLMSYTGLKGSFQKFTALLDEFKPISVAQADLLIDWTEVGVAQF